jgi:hypothetical protein
LYVTANLTPETNPMYEQPRYHTTAQTIVFFINTTDPSFTPTPAPVEEAEIEAKILSNSELIVAVAVVVCICLVVGLLLKRNHQVKR